MVIPTYSDPPLRSQRAVNMPFRLRTETSDKIWNGDVFVLWFRERRYVYRIDTWNIYDQFVFLDMLYINIYIYISMYTYYIYVIRNFEASSSNVFFGGERTRNLSSIPSYVTWPWQWEVWFQVGKSRIENNQASGIDGYTINVYI